jgi:hypothetical protein
MDLTGIIAISGKPGLYKVIGQGKNAIIVQSLMDGKRMPAHSSNKISSLEDITVYTTGEDVPLSKVLVSFYEKQEGKEAPSHKEPVEQLKVYLEERFPDYDKERMYNSDIQKLFQWYNLLHSSGELKERMEKAAQASDEAKVSGTEAGKETSEEKPAVEKIAKVKKPTAEGKSPKAASKTGGASKPTGSKPASKPRAGGAKPTTTPRKAG